MAEDIIKKYKLKERFIPLSELFVDDSQKWSIRKGEDMDQLQYSLEKMGLLEPLYVAPGGRVIQGRSRLIAMNAIHNKNPERFKVAWCLEFGKELPANEEARIVNHLKTVGSKVYGSDLSRIMKDQFHDLLKEKHSGNYKDPSKKMDVARLISNQLGMSYGYMLQRVAAYRKALQIQKLKGADLPLDEDEKVDIKKKLRKVLEIDGMIKDLKGKKSELLAEIRGINSKVPTQFLITKYKKGEL